MGLDGGMDDGEQKGRDDRQEIRLKRRLCRMKKLEQRLTGGYGTPVWNPFYVEGLVWLFVW